MTTVRLRYVHDFVDRHGHARFYFRFRGMRWPLPAPGEPGFMAAYEAHKAHAESLRTATPPARNVAFITGTLGWVIEKFLASDEYRDRAQNTKNAYRRPLDELRIRYGAAMLATLTDRNVKQIRNDMREAFTKSRADVTVGLLSTLWQFADEHLDKVDLGANPTHGIRRLHKVESERKPWPEGLIKRFESEAPPHLRLALHLLLYTGQRRGDVCKMEWEHFDGSRISVRQQKTDELVIIPCHAVLRATLATQERRHQFILLNAAGKRPYSGTGVYTAFFELLQRIDGTGYSIHGLRKNAAVALAEARCSVHQIMAVTGHKTSAMAMHYSKKVNQEKSATEAIERWEQSGNPRNIAGAKR